MRAPALGCMELLCIMTEIDTYKHLDKDSKVTVELSMPELAKHVGSLNYGAHRLLSAMVHELRAKNLEHVQRTRERDMTMLEHRRLNLPVEHWPMPLKPR